MISIAAFALALLFGGVLNTDRNAARVQALFVQSAQARVLPAHSYFLLNLRKRNAALSDRLFGAALDVLAARQWTEANEALILSSYLFSPDESIGYDLIAGYNAANVSSNASARPKNPALARRYLTLLLRRLNPSEGAPAPVVYFALKNLLPPVRVNGPRAAERSVRPRGRAGGVRHTEGPRRL